MKPQICICCGEPMAESGHALSRNPNVCASCSSMLDGMEEIGAEPLPAPTTDRSPPLEAPPPREFQPDEEIIVDWCSGQVSRTTLPSRK